MAAIAPITVNLTAATVVGPEDHLVIVIKDPYDLNVVSEIQESLKQNLPGLVGRVVFVDGKDIDAYVIRKGETNDATKPVPGQ